MARPLNKDSWNAAVQSGDFHFGEDAAGKFCWLKLACTLTAFEIFSLPRQSSLCTAFTETWGPPYDPHSFTASWRVADEARYGAANQILPGALLQGVCLGCSDALTIPM